MVIHLKMVGYQLDDEPNRYHGKMVGFNHTSIKNWLCRVPGMNHYCRTHPNGAPSFVRFETDGAGQPPKKEVCWVLSLGIQSPS